MVDREQVNRLLSHAVQHKASDIHLSQGYPPILRIDGKLQPMKGKCLEVEDMEAARARIEKAGAVHRPYPGTEEMAKRGNVEVKFSGPDGVTIDLSEHGWLGTK